MKIKSKFWLILIPVFLIILIMLFVAKPNSSFSSEMVRLEQLEQRLNFPTPDDRYKNDSGKHSDSKGVARNSRFINLYFNNANDVQLMNKKIQNDNQWKLISEYSKDGDQHYIFESDQYRACVTTSIDLDILPHSITLSSAEDDNCNIN